MQASQGQTAVGLEQTLELTGFGQELLNALGVGEGLDLLGQADAEARGGAVEE